LEVEVEVEEEDRELTPPLTPHSLMEAEVVVGHQEKELHLLFLKYLLILSVSQLELAVWVVRAAVVGELVTVQMV